MRFTLQRRLAIALWTGERDTRIRLQHWWLTVVIYAGCAGVMGLFTRLKVVSGNAILAWIACVLICLCIFHMLIRSGWSRRFGDAALSQAQIVFAIFAVMAGYTITGAARSAVLLPFVVVLNFGAFSIGWRRMVQLTVFALVVMGAVIVWMHARWPRRYSTVVDLSNFLVCMITLPGASALAMRLNSLQARLKQQRLDLKAALNRIQDLATLDELTGLANRRRARELLLTEITRVDRAVQSFSVALLDLDHFKQLNDRFGHAGGDQILCCFSEVARASVRSVDTVARWGGEEFLILMPETDVSHAFDVMERLRERIATLGVTSEQGDMHFTFSAGVAGHRLGQSVDETIVRADRALYAAKAEGRNRVECADNANGT
ncbi:Diguanylate cyclase, GGDEF domain (plasmid) [Caballeronia sp. SBC2]|nr:Diguanylate cyclase, GGDEF domain [Caballeronia sp. SBC2]